MSQTIRVTGRTVNEAVEEGLKQLGISRDQAAVHVLEEPSRGLISLIRKKQAVVEITPVVPEPEKDGKPCDEKTEAAGSEIEEAPEPAGEKEEIISGGTQEADQPSCEKSDIGEMPFSEEDQEKTAEKAREFLTDVFQAMHMEVVIEKMMSPERILFNLHGEGLGILIGKHGQTLNALQYLTNMAAGKDFKRKYFVLIDVEHYRERRQSTLESLAHRLAGRVKKTHEPLALEPMNASERRVIHMALQDDESITTDSEGEEPYRKVVIRPK
jgi:spoIIIJ-associated protein